MKIKKLNGITHLHSVFNILLIIRDKYKIYVVDVRKVVLSQDQSVWTKSMALILGPHVVEQIMLSSQIQ